MSKLTKKDVSRFEARLRRRAEELRRDMEQARLQARSEDAIAAVSTVRDVGDDSVAELNASTNLTFLDRNAAELRDIDEALERIREGTYGLCIECGSEIERERLEANPAATRDIDHERRFEANRAGGRDITPSL